MIHICTLDTITCAYIYIYIGQAVVARNMSADYHWYQSSKTNAEADADGTGSGSTVQDDIAYQKLSMRQHVLVQYQ